MATPHARQSPHTGERESKKTASFLDVVRAIGVTFGPSLVLDLYGAGSLVAVATGALARPPRSRAMLLLRPLLALGVVATALYLLAVRPWMRRWGATDEELRKPLPGDELVPPPAITATRAVTIHAPVEAVWPWLAQIGQDRGGFYSYQWLENLAGCQMRNADRVHPEWQHRSMGDTVMLHPAIGLKVTRFEPNCVLTLENGWSFVLEPIEEQTTRLLVRSRVSGGLGALYYVLLVELPHFVMEREMMLGIKARAERGAAANIERTPLARSEDRSSRSAGG